MTDRDDPLEAFFEAGRETVADPSEALLARVEADAMAAFAARTTPARATPSGWRGVLAALGGWPAGAGLGTAALAGLFIGFALPDTLADVSLPLTGDLSFDESALAPTYGTAWLDAFEE